MKKQNNVWIVIDDAYYSIGNRHSILHSPFYDKIAPDKFWSSPLKFYLLHGLSYGTEICVRNIKKFTFKMTGGSRESPARLTFHPTV
ncbi:MAG: hypothetical protein ACM3ZS_02515 [Nitrososphaerota archaeon]